MFCNQSFPTSRITDIFQFRKFLFFHVRLYDENHIYYALWHIELPITNRYFTSSCNRILGIDMRIWCLYYNIVIHAEHRRRCYRLWSLIAFTMLQIKPSKVYTRLPHLHTHTHTPWFFFSYTTYIRHPGT